MATFGVTVNFGFCVILFTIISSSRSQGSDVFNPVDLLRRESDDNIQATVIECPGKHYEYMRKKGVTVKGFTSRWNFLADRVEECSMACNQVINFDCKTFIFKHLTFDSANGTCMLSDLSEFDLEPVNVCFGAHCKMDLYHRIGCVDANCETSFCPDVAKSFCDVGEDLTHFNRTNGDCCALAECQCQPETCPEEGREEPKGLGLISATHLSHVCCPRWQLHCNTTCPKSTIVCSDPGQIPVDTRGPCCPEKKCVCQDSNCPLLQECGDDETSVKSKIGCCDFVLCKPKEGEGSSDGQNGTDSLIYPPCGEDGKYGFVDPVWCEVLTQVTASSKMADRVSVVVSVFFVVLIVVVICALVFMCFTLSRVGKNKLD